MRESKPCEYRGARKPTTILAIRPIYHPSSISLVSEVLVEISLPVPLEIVVTAQSLEDNEDAVSESGLVGAKTKNASFSELRGLQLLRADSPMC